MVAMKKQVGAARQGASKPRSWSFGGPDRALRSHFWPDHQGRQSMACMGLLVEGL
jgi:hypothetical protein